jgi:phasin
VSEAKTNEANTNPKANADVKRGLELPFFTSPGILNGVTEQSMTRAKENYEKLKIASGEITDVLREAYSSNAKGAAEYATKVIEFSGANTSSALDFLSHLMGTKSLSEILQLSITHGRKNIETTAAQNRELWEIARKVATETAEPIKKGFAGVLQKAS